MRTTLEQFIFSPKSLCFAIIGIVRFFNKSSMEYHRMRAFIHLQLPQILESSIELISKCCEELHIDLPDMDRRSGYLPLSAIASDPRILFDNYEKEVPWILADDSIDQQMYCDEIAGTVNRFSTKSQSGFMTGSDYGCLALARFCLDSGFDPNCDSHLNSWINYIIKWRSVDVEIVGDDDVGNWSSWLSGAVTNIHNWLTRETTLEDAYKITVSSRRFSSVTIVLNYLVAASKVRMGLTNSGKIERLDKIAKNIETAMKEDIECPPHEDFDTRILFAFKIIEQHNLTN
ncbi:hypothetical protein ACOME3_003082 [Neoechinorhynchus agilis]